MDTNTAFHFTKVRAFFGGWVKIREGRGPPKSSHRPTKVVSRFPFVFGLSFLYHPLFKNGVELALKGLLGIQNSSVAKQRHISPTTLPPLLLQTGDSGSLWLARWEQRYAGKYCFKMKEKKTRRLTCNISKNIQALGSWTWISGQSNLFKDANCSQTQKTVGFCLSFHKGCKLLIRLHCWAGHFVYQ